jgi:hypothetical protein
MTCLSSLDIDRVLNRFTHLNAFPAEFSRMLRLQPEALFTMFRSFKSFPVIIPFHCDFHWISVVLTEDEMICADSAPSTSHDTHLTSLFKIVSRWYKQELGHEPKYSLLRCARQPAGSTECGIHLLMNAVATCSGELLPFDGLLDLDEIRPVVNRIASGEMHPSSLIQQCRILAVSQGANCFAPLSHGQTQSWLDRCQYERIIGVGLCGGSLTVFPDRRGEKVRGLWLRENGTDAVLNGHSVTAICSPSVFIRLKVKSLPITELRGGTTSLRPLSDADVLNVLSSAKTGDIVVVSWSYASGNDTSIFRWVGILGNKYAKRWSIAYDIPDSIVHGIIPNPMVTYHSVEINPQGVPEPDSACRPTARRPVCYESDSECSMAESDSVHEDNVPSAPSRSCPSPVGTAVVMPPPSQVSATTGPIARRTTSRAPPAVIGDAAPIAPCHGQTEASFGTGVPEVDQLYADLHLQKNAPLPGKLRRVSGEDMSANELLRICRQPEVATHAMHRFHLAPSTVRAHKRVLRWLCSHLPPSNDSVDLAIPAAVAAKASDGQGWAPTSWLTHLNCIHGALAALFLYRREQVHVMMAGCPNWKAAIKNVQHLKPLHKPRQPKAATEEQVFEAMRLEPRPEVRAALEVGWNVAGRGGDIRQLLISDLNVSKGSGATPPTMTITFRRGKTAKRDQYAVGVPLPSVDTMKFLEAQRETGSWAFPGLSGKDLMLALRRVDPLLEQRSLRRGRLQHLAAKGWSDADLLEVSRHATIQMLRRYLDMGVVSATTRETAVRAARESASS